LLIISSLCFVSLIASILLAYLDFRKTKNESKKKIQLEIQPEKRINLKDILKFPYRLWFLIVICVTVCSSIGQFVSLGRLFILRKYDFSLSDAASTNR
jgi:hypothetical protein